MEEVSFYILFLTLGNLFLAGVNTYWAYKRTKYNEVVCTGSQKYWASWKARSKDITRKVLKEITSEQLEGELSKRRKKEDGR